MPIRPRSGNRGPAGFGTPPATLAKRLPAFGLARTDTARSLFRLPNDAARGLDAGRSWIYPTEYYGFHAKTTISIDYTALDGASHHAVLLFVGGPHCPTTARLDFLIGPGSGTKEIPLAGPSHGGFYTATEQRYTSIWGSHLANEQFDDIQLFLEGGAAVWVRHVRVVLNGIPILDKTMSLAVPVGGRPDCYYFGEDIRATRFALARMADDGTVNPVLEAAINDLGQAWHCKYGAVWPSGAPAPDIWCSEYAAWVIEQGTRGEVAPYRPTPDGFFGADQMADYFMQDGRFYCPTNFPYAKIGERIRPGWWIRVRRGGHSTLFLRWISENGTPCGFDAGADANRFEGLGGNQGGLVRINRYKLSRHDPGNYDPGDPHSTGPDVLWRGEQTYWGGKRYPDGFGNTNIVNPRPPGPPRAWAAGLLFPLDRYRFDIPNLPLGWRTETHRNPWAGGDLEARIRPTGAGLPVPLLAREPSRIVVSLTNNWKRAWRPEDEVR